MPEDKPRKPYFRSRQFRLDLAVIACVLILSDVAFGGYHVPSGSMRPTIAVGDYVLVNKLQYRLRLPFTRVTLWSFGPPARGDIVVFRHPESGLDYVKRVLGLPGDTVLIQGQDVTVNGKPLSRTFMIRRNGQLVFEEDLFGRRHALQHAPGTGHDAERRFRVPAAHFFVLGDNRDNSSDSRAWGFVPLENVKGRVLWKLTEVEEE